MKKGFLCFFLMLFAIALVGCESNKTTNKFEEATIVFEGAGSVTITNSEDSYEIPEYPLSAGQTFVGWGLTVDSTRPLVVDEVTYDDIEDYITDNTLHLYPIVEKYIDVTIHGVTDVTTRLSLSTQNQATLPLVFQSDRQKFLGWTTVQGGNLLIDSSTVINYDVVQQLAQNAKVDLYPVIEEYDLMICVHGSHSNGNIYVSTEQRALIQAQIELYFAENNINILVDYVDSVSAANFAKEAVKKDYDILLTSKSARNSASSDGDIATAAISVGKTYYAEADAAETVLSCIEIEQSRQVCRMLGSENEKPYQEMAYEFFITPVDFIIEVTFTNGVESETIEVHRVVDGEISQVSYTPSNEAILLKDGFIFDGWTTLETGTETEFANASYKNLYKLAVDGKVTIYPTFVGVPDAYILVWGINGTNEYVSETQYNQMVELFNAYLAEHEISTEGKTITIEYYQGKTADFQSMLTKEYISAAVGASALNNATYANYWTIDSDFYAQVLNVKCTNVNRYCALRSNAADNVYAKAFYYALCEAELEVNFAYGDVVTDYYTVNSTTKNVVEFPESIVAPTGSFLLGYALSANATETELTGNVTYASIADYVVEGKVTLYPIFGSYDLIVYIWCGQSKTGTTYVTEEEVEALKAMFTSLIGDDKRVVFYPVWGKTNDYGAQVGADADVVISGPNLNSSAQCGAILNAEYSKIDVINVSFESESQRYLGLTDKGLENDLAILLVKYLCEDYVEVSFDGNEFQKVYKVFTENLDVPEIKVEEGYELTGWATVEDATQAEFTNDTLTYATLVSKAVDKKITLYAVVTLKTDEPTVVEVIVAYHSYGAKATTVYFSDEMLQALQDAVATKLEEAGYDVEAYHITWNAYSGKVEEASASIDADGADVCIAHTQVYDSSKTSTPFVCASTYPATQFTQKTDDTKLFYCSSTLKVGVGAGSVNNEIAIIIYNTLIEMSAEQ